MKSVWAIPIPVSALICGSNICFATISLLATSIVADVMVVDTIWLKSLMAGRAEVRRLLTSLFARTFEHR